VIAIDDEKRWALAETRSPAEADARVVALCFLEIHVAPPVAGGQAIMMTATTITNIGRRVRIRGRIVRSAQAILRRPGPPSQGVRRTSLGFVSPLGLGRPSPR